MPTESTHWYTAVLAFSTGLPGADAFNVSLIPLRALDEEQALLKADRYGVQLAADYTEGRADGGSWVYERALFIHQMIENDLREGVEVYTFFTDLLGVQAVEEAGGL